MFSRDEIVAKSTDAAFGRPLVTNVHRSILVEAMVACALPGWKWCSADYASYDFENGGVRLEVKQTALKQSWISLSQPKPSWDIRPRTGIWVDGNTWIPMPGRNADIYVFGIHDVMDASADHREPSQWKFFVLPTEVLPATQRLSLAKASALTGAVGITELAEKVETVNLALNLIQHNL